ncbi:MAG: hypothetical protein ACTSRS_22060 [Candidatus Helarchaeota archaeon]
MIWYEWNENEYPICPICKRASVTFQSYKKQAETIYHIKPPKGKILALGKCLWGCTFNAIIPKIFTKIIDPNNILNT